MKSLINKCLHNANKALETIDPSKSVMIFEKLKLDDCFHKIKDNYSED